MKLNFFNTYKDLFTILISLVSAIVSIIVAVLTYKNLRELRNTRTEESRAYIVFYIEKYSNKLFHDLVIKNFGKSAGKLISLELDPPLSYKKSSTNLNIPLLTECKNIYLAPNQSISSVFDFKNYPDKVFNITIKYETLGKLYSENYQIDYSFRDAVLSTKPTIKTELDALDSIRKNIEQLSETLR